MWIAVIAGGLTVVKVSEVLDPSLDRFPQVLSLYLYIAVVCGILSFCRNPKSIDVKFPTGLNTSIPVLFAAFLGLVALEPSAGGLCGLLAIGGLPYGIFLLVLNVRRIKRRYFSLSILVYHLGSWLGWTAMWTLLWGIWATGFY